MLCCGNDWELNLSSRERCKTPGVGANGEGGEREERGKEEEGGEILGRITCVLPASGEQLLGIDSGLLILYP